MDLKEQITNLKSSYKNEELEFTGKELKKLIGISKLDEPLTVGNFIISKKIFSLKKIISQEQYYKIEIANDDFDLNNKPVLKNKKFVDFINNKFHSKNYEIHEDDLKKFEIGHLTPELTINNLLIKQKGITKFYKISIIDSDKDLEGRFEDGCFEMDDVIDAIEKLNSKNIEYEYNNEVEINELLVTHLRKYFVKAFKSAGKSKSFYDVSLGDEDIIIEIKLAKSLKSNTKHGAIGQLEEYSQETDAEILLLIIGTKEERQNFHVQGLESSIKKKKNIYYHYLQV